MLVAVLLSWSVQISSFDVIVSLVRLACSLALIRDLAVVLLCRKRYDSLPVSARWQ